MTNILATKYTYKVTIIRNLIGKTLSRSQYFKRKYKKPLAIQANGFHQVNI